MCSKQLLQLVALLLLLTTIDRAGAETVQVYFGTYTENSNGLSQGIYHSKLDLETGHLSLAKLAVETTNPSFIAIHPNGKWLYAVNETTKYKGEDSGYLTGFAIEKSGNLKRLNEHSTRGGAPCDLCISQNGRFILAANYVGGNVISLEIDDAGMIVSQASLQQHSGSSVTPRQTSPHAHSIDLNASQTFAFAADLGLDQVLVYRFDHASGQLTPFSQAKVAAGSGPRHFALHPKLPCAYVINEIGSSVTHFNYAEGKLTPVQTIGTLPADFQGANSTAELQITPNGRFLYGSNRGHHSLALYAVDQETGRLRVLGHQSTMGETPRNFNITPDGKWLLAANQDTNTVAVFKIQDDGRLAVAGKPVAVPRPVCIEFLTQ
jgi:6-phosphogluconolactonase